MRILAGIIAFVLICGCVLVWAVIKSQENFMDE